MSEAMDEVAMLREEIAELRDREAELRERVAELEDDDDTAGSVTGQFDARDAAVIDALTGNEGQTFHVRQLTSIYRNETDIRRQNTLKQRVKALVKTEAFESESGARHTFVGRSGGDDE